MQVGLLLGGILCLLAGALAWPTPGLTAAAERQPALVLDIAGPIGPATADYVVRGIEAAEEGHAGLIVLRMDTPGGLDRAMRSINKAILASNVPVAGFVAPSGSRAASAGTYILYACHIAAMAPSTTLGAATPVQIGGGGLPGMPQQPDKSPQGQDEGQGDSQSKGKGQSKGQGGDQDKATEPAPGDDKDAAQPPEGHAATMKRKIVNDAAAYIKGLAERRGRNGEWAQQAVRQAVSLTAGEALDKNVIDVIANDLPGLLNAIDGRAITLQGSPHTLSTAGLSIRVQQPDWRSELLSVITDPNVAYILMLVGVYGLIFEMMSPGAVVPGVLGAVSLLLALYAFQVLPINYTGLGLIILGILFMIGEAFVPSFGILGLGGVVAFVVGSVILMDTDQLAISLPLIGGTALVSAGFFLWVIGQLIRMHRGRSVTGTEQLVGMLGYALEDFESRGRVRVRSESWLADSGAPIARNQSVRVLDKQGLVLTVEPAPEEN